MTEPRRVVPGCVWFLSRRCTQRQFLLRPDPEMNNAYLYCVIEAAQKYGIVLLIPQMMSNHHHVPYFDPNGFAIEFMHRINTHIAKCVNAYRGRWENMWSSEEPCLVELEDTVALVKTLIYTATNPVKDDLVEKVHQWPGPNTVDAFLDRTVIKATRPTFFFREDGPMPETVEMTLGLPPELGDHEEIADLVRRGIESIEAKCARRRAAQHRQVLGVRRIKRQSWRDSPTSHEPRRTLRPRVAAGTKRVRIAALQRNKEFRDEYRVARAGWLDGEAVVFPEGTYWLRVFARVPTAGIYPPLTSTTTN